LYSSGAAECCIQHFDRWREVRSYSSTAAALQQQWYCAELCVEQFNEL
jgi:hypothetical protein